MHPCENCGGYDGLGTCLCDYDDLLREALEPFEPPVDAKQICHFCGVDLFLPRTDLNIRMCVSCGLALNHEHCCSCIVCNKTWLVDDNECVCESCMSL